MQNTKNMYGSQHTEHVELYAKRCEITLLLTNLVYRYKSGNLAVRASNSTQLSTSSRALCCYSRNEKKPNSLDFVSTITYTVSRFLFVSFSSRDYSTATLNNTTPGTFQMSSTLLGNCVLLLFYDSYRRHLLPHTRLIWYLYVCKIRLRLDLIR